VITPTLGSSLLTLTIYCYIFYSTNHASKETITTTDPEEEEDAMVTSKQFNKLMHMMESLTTSLNKTFNKTTTSMNEMFHKSQASTETTLERMQCGIAAMAD
jgi:hypothetical protein